MVDDIEVKEEGAGSEAEALADIFAWSMDCPEWQRDVLRRLCVKGELDDADLDELTVLCKSKGKGSVPLAADHIPDPDAAAMAVTLTRKIRGVFRFRYRHKSPRVVQVQY